MSQVSGLDEDCAVCQRRTGDHTMDEWAVCLGKTTMDLPFEEIPADLKDDANAALGARFGLDEGTIMADNVIVYGAVLDAAASGGIEIKIPVLMHEFQSTAAGDGTPVTVAKVLFMGGDGAGIRAYGRLLKNTANAAANKVGE